MKLLRTEVLFDHSSCREEKWFQVAVKEISEGIASIVWPPKSDKFTINPTPKGNGVSPIKDAFVLKLDEYGWESQHRLAIEAGKRPGPVDAIKRIPGQNRLFAVEWETGNISSSHRSLNRMCLGVMNGLLLGGILIVPSRKLYVYLTDRIGNFQEIQPYFPIWNNLDTKKTGFLVVMEVEHDAESTNVPKIRKGTDGRALI
jgi:hypothetical protein